MKKYMRLLLAALCAAGVLLMTGCWDDAEINGRAFVLGFGADKLEDGYSFIFQLAIPVSGDSDASGSIEYAVLAVNEITPAAAVRRIEKNLGREINFEQLSLIVIGEPLSRDNFAGLTDYFFRRASVRRQSCIAVCDGSAHSFFSASATNKAIALEAASTLQSYDAGSGSVSMNLFSLYKKLINRSGFFLPELSLKQAKTDGNSNEDPEKSVLSISGALAYGQNGAYRGHLTEDELELLLLACGSGNGCAIDVYDGSGSRYCCEVRESECSVKCRLVGGRPEFRIRLELVLVPLDAGGIDGGGYSPESIRHISQSAEQTLSKRLYALAEKSRSYLGISLSGLQDVARQRQPDWYRIHSDEWESIFQGTDIIFTVNCTAAGGGITK